MVTAQDFDALGLTEWEVADERAVGTYACESFSAAGDLAAQIARTADRQNHHPDLSLAYPGVVTVTTTSHDVGALTGRDLTLARAIHDLSVAAPPES